MNPAVATRPQTRFLRPVLVAGLGLVLATHVPAQPFKILHSFSPETTGVNNGRNSDGASPNPGLILSSNTLYGTAYEGGTSWGTVFKVNTDGSGFTTLHTFSSDVSGTNADGASPVAGLVLSGNTLYGTARLGGTGGIGTVFALNADGTGFKTLHSFAGSVFVNTNSDGWGPVSLVLSGDTLYGTAEYGGTYGAGTVFALNTDGTGFRTLYNFTGGSDGRDPTVALVLSGNALYGTVALGDIPNSDFGLFALNTDGTGFRTLYNVLGRIQHGWGAPNGFLLSGSSLVGTIWFGGSWASGAIYQVNTDSTDFGTLYNFTGTSDGASPNNLLLSGNTLYGTADAGGSWSNGTVFALNQNGTGFRTLHSFGASLGNNWEGYPINRDGVGADGLVCSGNTLYGSAGLGGNAGNGTIFSISLSPPLTIAASGSDLVLTWPTNVAGVDYSGFTVQLTKTLGPTAVWNTNFPPPVVVNGQFTVTNPISGAQQFYRLAQ
jgi:uncharacterized repeat protein (TIGR03803 family)